MDNQYRKAYSEILNNRWDHKFHIDNHILLNREMNKQLLDKFYNKRAFRYWCKSTSLLKLLNNADFQYYQSTLLRQYLEQPKKYLAPDCDFLSFVSCYEQGTKVLKKLTDAASGFLHGSNQALRRLLTVEYARDVGNGNKNRHKSEPEYNGVYTAFLFNDRTKYLKVYVAKRNQGTSQDAIRIDFIPTRFTEVELDILFSHLKSAMGTTNYKHFIGKSKLRRVDIAFNMPGIFQPSVFFHHQLHDKHITSGSSWPKDGLAETTYIAARSSNHFICYDKILKEAKNFSQQEGLNIAQRKKLVDELALVTRFERRHFSKRNGDEELPDLAQVTEVNDKLAELAIFDPIYLSDLPAERLRALLYNKSRHDKKGVSNWTVLNDVYEQYGDNCVVRLNGSEFEQQKKTLLSSLLKKLQYPQTILSEQLVALAKASNQHVYEPGYPVAIESKLRSLNAYKSAAQNTFIKAGAGSGKTRQIIKRVDYLVNNNSVKAKSIVVLAYTNKVVDEIRQKLELKKLKHVNTTTFTRWCAEILKKQDKKKYRGFGFIGSTEKGTAAYDWMTKTLRANGLELDTVKVFELFAFKQNKQVRLATAMQKKSVNVDEKKLGEVFNSYSKWLDKERKWDFESVMQSTYLMLKDERIARQVSLKYKYLLMDEMQDANKLQWRIFELLSNAGTSLFVVGDTAQSIFGFRGAEPKLIADFKAKLADTRTYIANANYRSTPNLLAVTNIVRLMCDPEAKPLVSSDDHAGQKPIISSAIDRKKLYDLVDRTVQRLLAQHYSKSSILIMCRTNDLVRGITDYLVTSYGSKVPECTTIHKAKGLEREVCIYIDPRFAKGHLDTQSEALNLTYVGLTRAEECLYIIRKACNSHGYIDGDDDDVNVLDILATKSYLFSETE